MNDPQVFLSSVLGAILVLVAVWQALFRREPGRNRAKFLGIELDLSTPALIILAAGCGLVLAPAFVPHRPGGWPVLDSAGSGGGAETSGPVVVRQASVVDYEREPNDSPAEANRIQLGQAVRGQIDRDSIVEYMVLAVPEEYRGKMRIIVRVLPGPVAHVRAAVWNEKEEKLIDGESINSDTISLVAPIASQYLIRISGVIFNGDFVKYEVLAQKE